jgi:hypothetical protein
VILKSADSKTSCAKAVTARAPSDRNKWDLMCAKIIVSVGLGCETKAAARFRVAGNGIERCRCLMEGLVARWYLIDVGKAWTNLFPWPK